VIALSVSVLTTVISAIVGAGAAYLGGRVERWILAAIHFLLVVPFGSTNNENLTGTGTPELDQKIKAAAEIADPPGRSSGQRAGTRGPGAVRPPPALQRPIDLRVSKGLANIGATIFGSPLPETIGWQK
jgi:hypothetical protein